MYMCGIICCEMVPGKNENTPPSGSIIPDHNRLYLSSDFWEQRYSSFGDVVTNDTREWFGNYSTFADIFRKYVNKSASILILGCGNSLLGEELYEDGYENIHNIDISPSVIKQMQNHCDKCSNMKWSVMDCKNLQFNNETFDVVIEKATIEVFLVEEKSPWTISTETIETLVQIGNEISRVLKPNRGQFISISFSAPHFRHKLLNKMFQNHSNKTVDHRILNVSHIHELGEHFHYYLYHLANDTNKSVPLFSYEPPKMTKIEKPSCEQRDDDSDLFLYDISV